MTSAKNENAGAVHNASGSTVAVRGVPGGGSLAALLIGHIITIVVALLLCGYATWSGIGNFLGVQNQRLQLGLDLSVVGWASIITLVVLPGIMFFACVAVIILIAVSAQKLRLRVTIYAFALGFAIVSVVNLDIVLALPLTSIFVT